MTEVYILFSIGKNPIVYGVYDNEDAAIDMYKKWRPTLGDLIISRRFLNKEF